MAELPRSMLICSCEDTMTLDVEAVQRGCKGTRIETARYLCRTEVERFRDAVKRGQPLTVGCTQEAPLFSEIVEEIGGSTDVTYVNIRETAGWSSEGRNAGAKMAALLAAAVEPTPDVPLVHLASEGIVLIYGRDEQAIEAGRLLKDHLDVTVVIAPPAKLSPPSDTEFPVVKGLVRSAKGHLGAFEITLDDFAAPAPSSRGSLKFPAGRQGAISRCNIILDVSGGSPLFSAADLRDGYLRADPDDPAAVLRAVLKARDLVGDFDKPRFITFSEELCAHSRSKIVGCSRCLDLCPAGAIAPAGDSVAIDPHICGGCGQCAAACPTGAASYAVPPADTLVAKLRAMLAAYRAAGGSAPQILIHDADHGEPLIDAAARFGDGLPARSIPVAVNEITAVGLESIAAAFAYGASSVQFLARAKPRHDITGLLQTIATANTLLAALGYGTAAVSVIETDDPEVLVARLKSASATDGTPKPASFHATGSKRDVLRLALRELHRAAPAPVDTIPLAQGAMFGRIAVRGRCLGCARGLSGRDDCRPA